MVLSGEQWLDEYFRPRLAAIDKQDGGHAALPEALRMLGGRLWAQVEALADTGVLNEQQERTALDLLRQAHLAPEIRSSGMSASQSGGPTAAMPMPVVSTSLAGPPPPQRPDVWTTPPRLLGVLPGPHVLGQFQGHPVTLVAAELWNNRLVVDLYTGTTEEYRQARERSNRAHLEWMARRRRGQQTGEAPPGHPDPPMQAARWELHDEQGTRYRRSGGAGEWSDHLDRLRLHFHPAPPPDARKVHLRATDPRGTAMFGCLVPVPRDRHGEADDDR
ncbi:MAG TPA: hypothetical protein VJX66_14960 [Amycolatopsis sp.]|nr:hypothetical protein [Amycolatopsis sp.]